MEFVQIQFYFPIKMHTGRMNNFLIQYVNFDYYAIVVGYMEGAMENSTSMSTPPEQVDLLIQVYTYHLK
jgi:hypothetical protein